MDFKLDISVKDRSYFTQKILRWAESNFSLFPWRKTKNDWHVLVAEIMLQRTNADQVVSVYKAFTERYKRPGDLLKNSKPGLFNNLGLLKREKRLKALAEILVKQKIPEDKKDLLKLPGVGNYIASAYRSLHLGKRDVIIDSNVVRILGRFFVFSTDSETRRKRWLIEFVDQITPIKKFMDFNYGLIDFTRRICKTTPLCNRCVLRRKCNYYQIIVLKNE